MLQDVSRRTGGIARAWQLACRRHERGHRLVGLWIDIVNLGVMIRIAVKTAARAAFSLPTPILQFDNSEGCCFYSGNRSTGDIQFSQYLLHVEIHRVL